MVRRELQKGMSMVAAVVVLAMIAFYVWLGICLIPVYYHNFAIKRILASTSNDSSLMNVTNPVMYRAQVTSMLQKQFDMNNLDKSYLDDMKVTFGTTQTTIELPYEARIHIVNNMDAVLSFHDVVEVPRQ